MTQEDLIRQIAQEMLLVQMEPDKVISPYIEKVRELINQHVREVEAQARKEGYRQAQGDLGKTWPREGFDVSKFYEENEQD